MPELRGAWDRDRLEQVFSNLIGNALVHGDPAKPVTVTAGGEALACGSRCTTKAHPFRRSFSPCSSTHSAGASTTSRSPAGLGLGLYISNEVVLRHGGQSRFDRPQAKERRFESSCRAKQSATPATWEVTSKRHILVGKDDVGFIKIHRSQRVSPAMAAVVDRLRRRIWSPCLPMR